MVRVGLAEAVGTFFLIYTGTATAAAATLGRETGGAAPDSLAIALAFGLVLTALVGALGQVSGAHLNGAVTLGLALIGRFPCYVPAYLIGQLLGAIAGAGATWLTFGDAARSAVPDGGGAEHQGASADVVEDGPGADEQVLEVVGVIRIEGQDFFPRALIQDQLQGIGTGCPGIASDPAELVVTDLAYGDAVVGDGLADLGHAVLPASCVPMCAGGSLGASPATVRRVTAGACDLAVQRGGVVGYYVPVTRTVTAQSGACDVTLSAVAVQRNTTPAGRCPMT